jgi:hypothetical protein
MMNRSTPNTGGDKTSIHMHQYNPPNMALGCFIGVMILLVIIIFFLGFSDNRLNQMVTNQNNTIAAVNRMASAFGINKAIQHHKGKGNFVSTQGPGGSINNMPTGAWGNSSANVLRNTHLNSQGINACSNGSCGSESNAYDVVSASNDPSMPTNSNHMMRDAALFLEMGVIDPADLMPSSQGSQPPMRRNGGNMGNMGNGGHM